MNFCRIIVLCFAGFAQTLSAGSTNLPQMLKGTVALSIQCSGSLVTFEGRKPSQKALMLTAGHCIGMGSVNVGILMPAQDEVFHRVKVTKTEMLLTGNADNPNAQIAMTQLLYATMTGIDIALYELSETYDEIEKRTAVKPFLVSAKESLADGLRVRSPSGLWRSQFSCVTSGTVPKLKEAGWLWGPSLRLSTECAGKPGTSGSPIIREDTNEVVAVLSTVYTGGVACRLNDPCEVNDNGAISVGAKNQTYGMYVRDLYGCLNESRDFDLATPGCKLPKP